MTGQADQVKSDRLVINTSKEISLLGLDLHEMNIEPEDKRLTIGFQKGQKGKQDDKENQEEHHTRRCDEEKDAQKAESNLG